MSEASDALQALDQQATPRPWTGGWRARSVDTGEYEVGLTGPKGNGGNDADLIVTLRNLLPELEAVVRAAERHRWEQEQRGVLVQSSERWLFDALEALTAKVKEQG